MRLLRLARRSQPNPTRRRLFPRHPSYYTRVSGVGQVQGDQRLPNPNEIAGLGVQTQHLTSPGGGDLDRRLRGLDLGQQLVELDGLTLGHSPLDQLGVGQAFGQVGQPEDELSHPQ